jgi:hypothetical protein
VRAHHLAESLHHQCELGRGKVLQCLLEEGQNRQMIATMRMMCTVVMVFSPYYVFTRTGQKPRPKMRAGTLRTSGTRGKRRSQLGGARG